MRRLLLLLILLLLTTLPAYAQSPPGARVTQVDASAFPNMKIYVSVTDAAGKPVAGLTARDFTLAEDGQPVTIGEFVGGGAGAISTVLVVDRSGSMQENGKMAGAKAAAQAFVRQMRPGDQTAVIAFATDAQLVQPFTADATLLDRAIRRVRADGSTALYDSLIAGVDQLKGLSGRRALLLLTDGRDMLSMDDPSPASRASLDQAIAAAVKAGISVQVIGLGDRDTADLRGGIDENVLRRIADESGGAYFYTPNADQLADLYRRLSAGMQQEYTMTYRSPRPFYDGTRRDIQVSVGGAPAASGGYVERHLIDVHSDPLVGIVLLLPILGLLLLPRLRRRATNDQRPATNDQRRLSGAQGPAPGACHSCGAALVAAGARFCMRCGAVQGAAEVADPRTLASPAVEARRIFCDQCGRPMRAGARFCSMCGATAPLLAADDRRSPTTATNM
jgi:Ca-activated chloride channel homolog